MELFTSFEGRISRKTFWLGLLGVGAGTLLLGVALVAILPAGVATKSAQLIVGLLVLYAWSAVLTKRLHDRNKAAMPWLLVFVAPGLATNIISIFQIGYTQIDLGGTMVPVPGLLASISMWLATAVAMWMVVELGMFKGTVGANRFGSDPLMTDPQTQPA